MKIIVRPEKSKVKIPVFIPLRFVKYIAGNKYVINAVNRYALKQGIELNYEAILQSIEVLKEYKGLVLVDVQASDGTYVKITV